MEPLALETIRAAVKGATKVRLVDMLAVSRRPVAT
jgi:hypothetical protein